MRIWFYRHAYEDVEILTQAFARVSAAMLTQIRQFHVGAGGKRQDKKKRRKAKTFPDDEKKQKNSGQHKDTTATIVSAS